MGPRTIGTLGTLLASLLPGCLPSPATPTAPPPADTGEPEGYPAQFRAQLAAMALRDGWTAWRTRDLVGLDGDDLAAGGPCDGAGTYLASGAILQSGDCDGDTGTEDSTLQVVLNGCEEQPAYTVGGATLSARVVFEGELDVASTVLWEEGCASATSAQMTFTAEALQVSGEDDQGPFDLGTCLVELHDTYANGQHTLTGHLCGLPITL